jgi:hypothetical protein
LAPIRGHEVGTDTAQDDDGHIGGQTYLSFGGGRVNLTSSKTSGRFTAMRLTAGTGEPVMCIIIFAPAELYTLARLGFDHRSKIPYDKEKSLEENMGPGKALPGAPTYLLVSWKGGSDTYSHDEERVNDFGDPGNGSPMAG